MNDEDLDHHWQSAGVAGKTANCPKRYRDILPEPPAAPPAPQPVTSECAPTMSPATTRIPLIRATPNIYSVSGSC